MEDKWLLIWLLGNSPLWSYGQVVAGFVIILDFFQFVKAWFVILDAWIWELHVYELILGMFLGSNWVNGLICG